MRGWVARHHRLVPLPLRTNSIELSRPAGRMALARYLPWLSGRLPHRSAPKISRPFSVLTVDPLPEGRPA